MTSSADASTASVIIAAHTLERCSDLCQAVASAFSQEPPPHEVIVAVDNNTDLYDWVGAHLPDTISVHNQGTAGASATRNAGAMAAGGSILAFLDDDAMARPGWLQNLTAPFARQDVLGVGGRVEPVWRGSPPKWMPDEFMWVVGASYRGLPKTAAPIRNVWSENMAVRRADFWAVGGFREGFGKIGNLSAPEDTDFCIRLTAEMPGRTWWYEPAARVGHTVPSARGTLRFFIRRCYNEGRGKADLAVNVGTHAGLEDERRHATRTLPDAVRRELRQAVAGREFVAAQRASAIGLGLGAAGLGYVVRRSRLRVAS